MNKKIRINSTLGGDKLLTFDLNQDFDILELLSLKFTQKDIYTSTCSDYGVVCGRISVNNGFGVPNAKVSIFIPLSENDENNQVISSLYPYKTISDLDENNYRYNLLPSKQQHKGHAPTGTFPEQSDILSRSEYLEIYEKYYKFTVKTNQSGDFMIWGVPLGTQILHVDIDLSDIGCFSLRPYDFIVNGVSEKKFKNTYEFDSSTNIDSLPQIVSFSKTIEVYPFWGNEDLCEIGITRTDFDLTEKGVQIRPKAFLIGGTYTDSGKNAINKNCNIRPEIGKKCDLITKSGSIDSIRFTNEFDEQGRPILEVFNVNDSIDDNGTFMVELPMNLDYIVTNEFGENIITDDENFGIPTAGNYRLRFSLDGNNQARTRTTASYLVPNIREYTNDIDKSYSFSTSYDDYPQNAVDNLILNKDDNGFYVPQDYFYRFTYNKVYTVSSFHGSYVTPNNNFLGIKELLPSEEDDCSSEVLTPPINFGFKNDNFKSFLNNLIFDFEYSINKILFLLLNTIIRTFHTIRVFGLRKLSYNIQNITQKEFSLISYPDCEKCATDDDDVEREPTISFCTLGSFSINGLEVTSTETRSTGTFDSVNSFVFNHNLNSVNIIVNLYTTTGQEFLPQSITIDDPNTITVTLNSTTSGTIVVERLEDFDRSIIVSGLTFTQDNIDPSCPLIDLNGFITNQYDYFINFNGITIGLEPNVNYFYQDGQDVYYYDGEGFFSDSGITYNLTIRNNTLIELDPENNQTESICERYKTPYDENIIQSYYIGENRTETAVFTPGMIIDSVRLSDNIGNRLPLSYNGDIFNPITESGYSEFKNGVFYVIPGSQSNNRLSQILREYKRRVKITSLFCGGIVNYSFIDNWMGGSLYFYLFKSKNKNKKDEQKVKYCRNILRWVSSQERFYYRSTKYNPLTNLWGEIFDNNKKRLGNPTTIIDLGPRDGFINEICLDNNVDGGCAVARRIGATSFKSFGDILGLAINYRLDVSGTINPKTKFDIDNFFDNRFDNFTTNFFRLKKVLDGDILQLISINSEVGIEEFDINDEKYSGYSYYVIDPDINESFYKQNDVYGPTPITFELDETGAETRLCMNSPGLLTESSQLVPFYLWDKKATQFGLYDENDFDKQSWDYTTVELQKIQGMTYNYAYTGNTDQYILLPMTYNYDGLIISGYTTNLDFNEIALVDKPLNFDAYPGFTYLYVTNGTVDEPLEGILYVRYGATPNQWDTINWNSNIGIIIKKTEDYYTGNKQILSTPFLYYFGLRPGRTSLDRFIKYFGDENSFD